MYLPLYDHSSHEHDSSVKKPDKGNIGLWYNKFVWTWQQGGKWELKKLDWIKKVSNRKIGDSRRLKESTFRVAHLTQALGGQIRMYSTKWHLATGLGLSHPVEIGMTWHHTLGVPYLPGSTVKGLVRTWAEEWAVPSPQFEDINRIFGLRDEEKNSVGETEKKVGTVIFFDALPVQPVKLVSDIMTPHYQKYYSGDGNHPPGDWYNPNPIPFLAVGAEQAFLFAVAPRKKENTADLSLVLQWLDEVLAMIGAGAKTAAGYGRFVRNLKLEQEYAFHKNKTGSAAVKDSTEKLSLIPKELAGPLAEEMDEDGYSDNPDKFMKSMTIKWIKTMLAEETSFADRQIIAKLLKHWYQINKSDQWQKPNKKNAVKIAAIKKILGE